MPLKGTAQVLAGATTLWQFMPTFFMLAERPPNVMFPLFLFLGWAVLLKAKLNCLLEMWPYLWR